MGKQTPADVGKRLEKHLGEEPMYGPDVFVAPTAVVLGDVQMDEGSSLWYGGVLRGDINSIRIGKCSNLQDGVIGHRRMTIHLMWEICHGRSRGGHSCL